jgi:hypothetical protein
VLARLSDSTLSSGWLALSGDVMYDTHCRHDSFIQQQRNKQQQMFVGTVGCSPTATEHQKCCCCLCNSCPSLFEAHLKHVDMYAASLSLSPMHGACAAANTAASTVKELESPSGPGSQAHLWRIILAVVIITSISNRHVVLQAQLLIHFCCCCWCMTAPLFFSPI